MILYKNIFLVTAFAPESFDFSVFLCKFCVVGKQYENKFNLRKYSVGKRSVIINVYGNENEPVHFFHTRDLYFPLAETL
jgi:hypothetical protein